MISQPTTLNNLRVLDFTHVLSGPWATQLLGDFGADVTKIEKETGDMSRQWGRATIGAQNVNSYFASCNRNKSTLIADLNDPEHRRQIEEMLPTTAVVIENFRPGTMAKFGLDYESLKEKYPDIIYCSISGYGQTGEMSSLPAVDQLIQASSGMMDLNGLEGPQKVGLPVVDVMTGMYAAAAILAALNYRRDTGHGQYIDIAMRDVAIAMMANHSTMYVASSVAPPKNANHHHELSPYGMYRTKDASIYIAVSTDEEFKRLAHVVKRVTGCRGLLDDSRFSTNRGRLNNSEMIQQILRDSFKTAVSDVWITFLGIHNVPCAPVNSIADALNSTQTLERGMVTNVDGMNLVANPIRFSATPVQYVHRPRALAESVVKTKENEQD